jgi:hypothetical protein
MSQKGENTAENFGNWVFWGSARRIWAKSVKILKKGLVIKIYNLDTQKFLSHFLTKFTQRKTNPIAIFSRISLTSFSHIHFWIRTSNTFFGREKLMRVQNFIKEARVCVCDYVWQKWLLVIIVSVGGDGRREGPKSELCVK